MSSRGTARHITDEAARMVESPIWAQTARRYDEAILRAMVDCEDAASAYDLVMMKKAGVMYEKIMKQLARDGDIAAAAEYMKGRVA